MEPEKEKKFRFRLRLEQEQGTPEAKTKQPGFWEAVGPTATQVKGTGPMAQLERGYKSLVDVADIPTRAAAKLRGIPMSDPNSYFLRPEVEKIQEKSDPVKQQFMDVLTDLKSNPTKMKEYGVTLDNIDFAEGALDSYNTGVEFLGKLASDPGVWLAPFQKIFKKLKAPFSSFSSKITKKYDITGPRKFLKEQAEGVQKIDAQVLEDYGWGFGKDAQKIRAAARQEGKFGEELVERIYNAEKYIPEGDQVREIIKTMPDIETVNVVKTLENYAKRIEQKYGATEKASIRKMRALAKDYGSTETLTAKQFRSRRLDLDKKIKWAQREGLDHYQDALKEVRLRFKKDMIRKAPPEYAPLMDNWAEKEQAIAEVKDFLGKNIKAGEKKGPGFIKNLYGSGKQSAQKVIKKFDGIFETNFAEKAEYLEKAKQLGPRGKPLLTPYKGDWETLPVLMGYGSPWVTSKTLSTLRGVELALQKGLELTLMTKHSNPIMAASIVKTAVKELTKSNQNKVKILSDRYNRTKDPKRKALIERNLNRLIKMKEKNKPTTYEPIED